MHKYCNHFFEIILTVCKNPVFSAFSAHYIEKGLPDFLYKGNFYAYLPDRPRYLPVKKTPGGVLSDIVGIFRRVQAVRIRPVLSVAQQQVESGDEIDQRQAHRDPERPRPVSQIVGAARHQ